MHIIHACTFHSLWLLGYLDVMQTIPVILKMAGLFKILDRPQYLNIYHTLYSLSINVIFHVLMD